MKLNSLVIKNFSYLFISSISRFVANSLLFVIVARFYGAEIFGSLSSSYTLSFLFTYLADFGFDIFITSEVAKDKSNLTQLISKYLPIKIFTTILSCGLFFIASFLIPSNEITKIILLIFSLSIVFSTLLNFIFSIFKGIERFDFEAVISFFSNVALLIGIIILSYNKANIIYVAVLIVFFKFIGLILGLIQLRKFINYSKIIWYYNFRKIFSNFRLVSIYGLDLLFGAIYLQIDTVFLLSLKGETEAGLYQAVFRIAMILFVMPDLIINTLFPTVVRLFHQQRETWKQLSEISLKFLFTISLPIAFFLTLYSKEILELLYGNEEFFRNHEHLQSSVLLLNLISLVVIIRFLATPFAMVLTVQGNQLKRTIIVIVAAAISITLNIIIIPSYGALGTVIISVITNIYALSSYVIISKNAKWLINKNLILVLSIMFFVWLLQFNFGIHINIVINIFISISYILFVYFIVFSKKDKLVFIK